MGAEMRDTKVYPGKLRQDFLEEKIPGLKGFQVGIEMSSLISKGFFNGSPFTLQPDHPLLPT